MTPTALLDRELRRDATRPLITWYDDAVAGRIELSVATTSNWAVKVANALTEEDAGPATVVGLSDPAHWLAPVCVLGAWAIGAIVGPVPAEVDLPAGDDAEWRQAVLAQPDVLVGPGADTDVETFEVPPGARLLSTEPFDSAVGQALLAGVLAAGGSLVVVRNPAADRLEQRCGTERVTHTFGIGVGSVPRLH